MQSDQADRNWPPAVRNERGGTGPDSWWRERCLAWLEADDWYMLYKTAMSWRSAGAGMWMPEPWLMDVCSSLLHRQPKTAVHCTDMALHTWVGRPGDRSMLRYVRGLLIADHMSDPRSALDDLRAATQGPQWLTEAHQDLARVTEAATRSRVRKPRALPCPDFEPDYMDKIGAAASTPFVRPAPEQLPDDGAAPPLWTVAFEHIRRP